MWHHLEHLTLVTASIAMATDVSGDPVVGITALFEGYVYKYLLADFGLSLGTLTYL
jgi:hypothetical protein